MCLCNNDSVLLSHVYCRRTTIISYPCTCITYKLCTRVLTGGGVSLECKGGFHTNDVIRKPDIEGIIKYTVHIMYPRIHSTNWDVVYLYKR